jgi:hypothetical protein
MTRERAANDVGGERHRMVSRRVITTMKGNWAAMVDPETLLAMVQEAQRRHNEGGDYGEVDWGESDKDS